MADKFRAAVMVSAIGTADGKRKNAKITVNERVDQILQGSLLQMEEAHGKGNGREEAMAERRAREIATLYATSLEDKMVRATLRSERVMMPKSVPKHLHLGGLKTPEVSWQAATAKDAAQLTPGDAVVSPLKPVRCISKLMLEQREHELACEHEKRHANDYPSPNFEPRKPWCSGCTPVDSICSCTVDSQTRRYGAYGTIKMLTSQTVAGTAPPFRLQASQSLDALTNVDTPDAWSPPLQGSPSLWPEETTFGHSSKLTSTRMQRCPSPDLRYPTHCVGQTSPNPSDTHYARMQAVHARDAHKLKLELAEEQAQRQLEIDYNRGHFQHWKAQLHLDPLARPQIAPLPAGSHIKRGQELTIVQTPAHALDATYDDQVAKLWAQRFALRWQSLPNVIDGMKRTPCRRPVLQDLDKLSAIAYDLSLANQQPFALNRQQFVDLLQREFPPIALADMHRVFSSYDPRLSDSLDVRVFLATIRMLRVQQGTPLELVCTALQDFDISKQQVVAEQAHFEIALSLCCASDAEEQRMLAHAKQLWMTMQTTYIEEPMDDTRTEASESEANTRRSVESLLFLGRDSMVMEHRRLPIRFVRKALRQEKHVLQAFSELLTTRRDDCAAVVPAASRSAKGTNRATGKRPSVGSSNMPEDSRVISN